MQAPGHPSPSQKFSVHDVCIASSSQAARLPPDRIEDYLHFCRTVIVFPGSDTPDGAGLPPAPLPSPPLPVPILLLHLQLLVPLLYLPLLQLLIPRLPPPPPPVLHVNLCPCPPATPSQSSSCQSPPRAPQPSSSCVAAAAADAAAAVLLIFLLLPFPLSHPSCLLLLRR